MEKNKTITSLGLLFLGLALLLSACGASTESPNIVVSSANTAVAKPADTTGDKDKAAPAMTPSSRATDAGNGGVAMISPQAVASAPTAQIFAGSVTVNAPPQSGSVASGGSANPTATPTEIAIVLPTRAAIPGGTMMPATMMPSANFVEPVPANGAKPAQPILPRATAPVIVDQTPLKAGAVDDNLRFGEYLTYIKNYSTGNALAFDVNERYLIKVVDGNAKSVANADVEILSGDIVLFKGKTYSDGQTAFFPRAIAGTNQFSGFEAKVTKAGKTTSKKFERIPQQTPAQPIVWTLTIDSPSQVINNPTLDLLFLLDSTGSMGGEISKIQQTIKDIAYQISVLPSSPKIRYGVVTYRDRNDTYITRKYGFTDNLGDFSNFLNTISAGGGGDIPESLNEALHVTLNDMNWTKDEAVRLTFLVADAPPHLDYAQDYKYTDEASSAVSKGIKIYSIGASGLSKSGEYILRQIALITQAQYLFITRGGDEAQPGSGGAASNTGTDFEERTLDRIVVNIVRRELLNLTQQP